MLDIERYIGLIEGILPRSIPFIPEAERESQIQVERGSLFPLAIQKHVNKTADERVERLIHIAGAGSAGQLAVVDRLGHCRPAYRGLLVYAWAQSLEIERRSLAATEIVRWENAISAWCVDLAARAQFEKEHSAAHGAAAADAAWSALALQASSSVADRSDYLTLAAAMFASLMGAQRPSGAFLTVTSADNPETYWYHELVLLHAVASYAVHGRDDRARISTARAAEYHQSETQSDHASNQPWGLLAFILNETTGSYADELLHAAAMQPTGITAILLGDVLWCLREIGGPGR